MMPFGAPLMENLWKLRNSQVPISTIKSKKIYTFDGNIHIANQVKLALKGSHFNSRLN